MDSAYFLFDGPASGAVTTVVAAGGTEEDLHSAEKVDVCGCSVPRRPCCPEGYYWKDLSCWQSKEVRYSHIIFTLLFVFSVVGLLCMFMFFGYLDEGFHGVSIPLSVSALLSIYTFVYAIQALVTLQHPEDYVDTDHMRTSDTCCNGMSCVATLCYLRLCGVVVPLYLLIELALCISLFLAMVVQQWFVPIPNYLIVLVLIAVVTVNVYIRREINAYYQPGPPSVAVNSGSLLLGSGERLGSPYAGGSPTAVRKTSRATSLNKTSRSGSRTYTNFVLHSASEEKAAVVEKKLRSSSSVGPDTFVTNDGVTIESPSFSRSFTRHVEYDRADRTQLSWCSCLLRVLNKGVYALAFLLLLLLQVGSWGQAIGYGVVYSPEGTFITVNYKVALDSYHGHYHQRIHHVCKGAFNSTVPTIFMEVGGGGHSMSDLWGLRDVLSAAPYHRRVCSYDMPGVGWSDNMLSRQPFITEEVLAATGEKGPFIFLSSMDDADLRVHAYALAHPENVKALVLAGGAQGEGEFLVRGRYLNQTREEMYAYARSTLEGRLTLGHLVNMLMVSTGFVRMVTSPDYHPKARSKESSFLNIWNERGWTTNNNIIYQAVQNLTQSFAEPVWKDPSRRLNSSIPIFSIMMEQTDQELQQQCIRQSLSEIDCGLLKYTYAAGIALNTKVVQASANGKLVTCATCQDKDNGFVVNQVGNIGWFASTMMKLIESIHS